MTAEQAIRALLERVQALEADVQRLTDNVFSTNALDADIGEIPGLGSAGDAATALSGSPSQAHGATPVASAPKARIEDPPGSGQWNYAPPTPAQRELRERLLPLVALENLPADRWNISKEDAEAAFLKGGPLWLYDTDREYIMGLPAGTRQGFVQDVNLVDTDEAELLARDLLKVWDEDAMLAPEDILERDAQWRARGGSAVAGAYRGS